MRREPSQDLAFVCGLAHQRHVALLEIADAAVNQLRAAAARAGGEVVALDERDGEPAESRIARDTGAGDPAADDEQVEPLGRQPREHGLARLR